MNYWFKLPDEIQLYIIKFTRNNSPLKICHKEIKNFYKEELQNSWPLPYNKKRIGEHKCVVIIKRKNNNNIIRYYRTIYGSINTVLHTDKKTFISAKSNLDKILYSVDVTQAKIEDIYKYIYER